jgi:hypothetical protein
MTTEAENSTRTLVTRKVRAYFAPAASGSAAIPFSDVAELPPGWADLGWIEGFRRIPGTRREPLRAGGKGAAVGQFSAMLEARVEFDFLQWGKLQMALTAGGPQMNVLAAAQGATLPATPLMMGSTATELFLPGTQAFLAGDLIAVDVDYSGQTGNIGTGIAGAWVKDAADLPNDPHYVRRVTFNVARISSVTPASVVLEEPLLCGAPPAGAKVQKVTGFMDREGNSFFPEWSAIFVMDGEAGGQVSFQYPRLQVAAPAQEQSFEIAAPLEAVGLRANFRALPVRDALDNEQVLCYRCYTPAQVVAV